LQITQQDAHQQALGVAEAGLNHVHRFVVASGGGSRAAGGGTGGTLPVSAASWR
jgi:hypothetical protein